MKKVILIVVAVVVLVGVGKYVYDVNIDHNFEPVAEGKVYRSGVIPPDELPGYLKKYNIKTVVDLRRPGTNDTINNPEIPDELIDEREAVATVPGAQYVNVPSTQLPDQETLNKFYAVMDNPDNYPVLIHCHHGEGRAPLYGAIYQVEYGGLSKDDARKNARWFPELCVFGKNKSKGQYLLNYKTREEQKLEASQN